ncbi:glutathione S-transferase [Xylaria curta]|nr:glutathione S-transferase [Xylaria curta]
MQPIKVYNGRHGTGPNPWKVIIVLAELDLPYQIEWIDYSESKEEPYTLLNPNGRLPAMVDPNKGVTLFESGAIINYIVDVYDKNCKLTYGDDRLAEKYQVQSWLMLQMSGQGPMFGQMVWFTYFHVEENLTTPIKRYTTETKRICSVIDNALRKRRAELSISKEEPVWLVGEHYTYADLSFVMWNRILLNQSTPEDENWENEMPEFYRWHKSLVSLPAVSKVLEFQAECIRTMKDSASEVRNRQADARKF